MGSLFLRRSHNSSFFFSCQQNLAERFANSSRGGFPFSCKFSQLASPSPKRDGPLSFYRSLVQQGKLKHDIYQERVASELEDLLERLKQYEKEMEKYHASVATWEKNREAERRWLLMEEAEVKQKGGIKNTVNKRRSGFFNKWFPWRKSVDIEPGAGRMVSYLNREKKLDSVVGTRPVAPQAPKGLYLYGSVGSETVDVFAIVALSGILSRLLSTGTVLVATSNRAPEDLNQDGMQKDIFLKLVTKLEEHCQNIVVGRDIDYRRLIAKKTVEKAHYFWPLDNQALKEFECVWNEITTKSGGSINSNTIPVMFGRVLKVPESCDGVARFEFDYLCGRPLGAADYIAIAKNYHTVFISDIPLMSMRIRDKARRFITLIDELYNHHCCLFCTAAASIDDLFQGTDEGALFDLESFQFETEIEGGKLRRDVLAEGSIGSGPAASGIASLLSGQEEMFAFQRAVSRLIEMQTSLYLEGVRQIHPYFQWRQGCEEPLNIHRSTQRLQLS